MPSIITNVTLTEIRDGDNAQKYEWDISQTPEFSFMVTGVIWLTGWNRASGVEVGDKGRLVYRSGPGYSLWFFEKEELE